MRRIGRVARQFRRRLSDQRPADRWLLAEAAIWQVVAWAAVRAVPFRRWAGRLGTLDEETAPTDDPGSRQAAERVSWAVSATSRWVPWRATCLMEAVAAKKLLERRGVSSTLYLGVASADPETAFEAHAWLRCGTAIVTGDAERQRFTAVTAFGPHTR